jgi:hypothetical protein
MRGTVDDLLDDSASKGHANDLLKMCAGVSVGQHSVSRPVDLVLCGHTHNRVEFRLSWTGSEMLFYTDFYTENPRSYYGTHKGSWDNGNMHIGVLIEPGAVPNAQPAKNVQDNQWDGEEWTMTVPPYGDPLNSAADRTRWWREHRPLVMQTGAIGPMEIASNSRHQPGKPKPNPSFQGFRVLTVAFNTINAMHYVSMEELRASQFTLPWEKFEGAYVEIRNVSKPDRSLSMGSGSVVDDAIQPGLTIAQWQLQPVAANVCWIRSRSKSDEYLHIESGSLGIGPIQANWDSARWTVEPVPGTDNHYRFRNVWKPDECLNIETGALQASPIQAGWLSARWTIDFAESSQILTAAGAATGG